MQRVDGRDVKLPAYAPGCYVKAEFRMGVDNIQIEGPHQINNLFFDKKADPVLGLGGKLERSDPKNIFLRNRLGVLDGKNIGPVAPPLQFVF
jgi:hypothetical protein